ALRLHADVPLLGDVLPVDESADRASVDRVDLAAVARERTRPRRKLRHADHASAPLAAHRRPARAVDRRVSRLSPPLRAETRLMTTIEMTDAAVRRGGVRALWSGNPQAVVQRGLVA